MQPYDSTVERQYIKEFLVCSTKYFCFSLLEIENHIEFCYFQD